MEFAERLKMQWKIRDNCVNNKLCNDFNGGSS